MQGSYFTSHAYQSCSLQIEKGDIWLFNRKHYLLHDYLYLTAIWVAFCFTPDTDALTLQLIPVRVF